MATISFFNPRTFLRRARNIMPFLVCASILYFGGMKEINKFEALQQSQAAEALKPISQDEVAYSHERNKARLESEQNQDYIKVRQERKKQLEASKWISQEEARRPISRTEVVENYQKIRGQRPPITDQGHVSLFEQEQKVEKVASEEAEKYNGFLVKLQKQGKLKQKNIYYKYLPIFIEKGQAGVPDEVKYVEISELFKNKEELEKRLKSVKRVVSESVEDKCSVDIEEKLRTLARNNSLNSCLEMVADSLKESGSNTAVIINEETSFSDYKKTKKPCPDCDREDCNKATQSNSITAVTKLEYVTLKTN